jgi:hypothetical protein
MTTASFQVLTGTLLQEITKKPAVQFTKPDEIGYFSYDIHRTLSLDRSQLVLYFLNLPLSNHFAEKISPHIRNMCTAG